MLFDHVLLIVSQISKSVKEDLTKALHKYPNKDETFIRRAFNRMQSKVNMQGYFKTLKIFVMKAL